MVVRLALEWAKKPVVYGANPKITVASNKAVLGENAVSKLYYLQFITIAISTFSYDHFLPVQFHLKSSKL